MNHLLRSLAPITDGTWEELEDEARERLAPALAARKLVDFGGPRGWTHSATNLGRVSALEQTPVGGVRASRRRVLPLTELRTEFTLERAELEASARGADDGDWGPLDLAARKLAEAENHAVFHGWPGAFTGIIEASPHAALPVGADAASWANTVADAVEVMLESGVGGQYGLALGPAEYRKISGSAEGTNRPLFEVLTKIITGPIIWTPGLAGGVVLSLRGGDFVIDSGQDVALGYLAHDADSVQLYLEESFSFHVATPEAAVALAPQ